MSGLAQLKVVRQVQDMQGVQGLPGALGGRAARFTAQLRSGKTEGSESVATSTVNFLEQIISENEYGTAIELLSVIGSVGRQLTGAAPQEGVLANMVRRVLRVIREEYRASDECRVTEGIGGSGEAGGASLQQLVRAAAARRSVHMERRADLRAPVLDHIAELKNELETSAESIASQAPEHIHANELILTYGASRLVERFLRRAARDRSFHVILAEGADTHESHQMAVNLARAKIECTVVAECAVMAVMSRVNKVILGTQAVLASGGLRARAGAHTVALAAKHYSVPVIVLSPLYKLCPVHLCSYEQDDFNTLVSPDPALPYQSGSVVHKSHSYAPLYDYVPPDLVTLFLTNLGGNSPSYVYRMMSELYDPVDYQL